MVYTKKGKRIRARHEIAAGSAIPGDRETTHGLPIKENYLYSISMMVRIRLINQLINYLIISKI
jgi:hypothetical protein